MVDIKIDVPKTARFQDARQVVFDASTIDLIMRCPTLYNLRARLGWRPKKERKQSLFGNAVHFGCEQLDLHRAGGVPQSEAMAQALVSVLTRYGPDLRLEEDAAYNMEAASRAIVWRALEFYNDNFMLARLEDGTPALEVRFEVPVPGADWRMSGRIDRMASLNEDLYVVDTKTTKSSLSDYWFASFHPLNQSYAYVWAMRRVLGLPVKGFMVEGVQTGVNFTRFSRMYYFITDAQLDEWLASVKDCINRVDKYRTDNVWPQYFSACHQFGGCSFRSVCSRPEELRVTWLSEDFERHPHETFEEPKPEVL